MSNRTPAAVARLHRTVRNVTDNDRALYTLVFLAQGIDGMQEGSPERAPFEVARGRQVLAWDTALGHMGEVLSGCFPRAPYRFGEDGWSDAALYEALQEARAVAREWNHGPDILGTLRTMVAPLADGGPAPRALLPYAICEFMVIAAGIPRAGQAIHDPRVGTGRLLMTAYNLCRQERGADVAGTLRLSGSDDDPLAVELAGLNCMALGIGHQVQLAVIES